MLDPRLLVAVVVAFVAGQELFHLGLARRVQLFLSRMLHATLIHTFVIPRLDSYNALCVKLQLETIWK